MIGTDRTSSSSWPTARVRSSATTPAPARASSLIRGARSGSSARRRATRTAARAHTLHQVVDGNQRFLGMLPTGHGPGPTLRTAAREPLLEHPLRSRRRVARAWARAVEGRAGRARARVGGPCSIRSRASTRCSSPRITTSSCIDGRRATSSTSAMPPMRRARSSGRAATSRSGTRWSSRDVLAAEESDLAVALDRYSRLRADHLAFYQFSTRMLTPFFQGDEAMARHAARPDDAADGEGVRSRTAS